MDSADPSKITPEEVRGIANRANETVMQLMDTLTTLQVFGSPEVGELANELGQHLIAHRDELHDTASTEPSRADLGAWGSCSTSG